MKQRTILTALLLLATAAVLQDTAQAAWRYRYVQYRRPRSRNYPRPAQPTNQIARPTQPQEKPVQFKDLPVNTEFYYLADKDHKNFPYIKISDTSAKSVPTAAKPQATVATVPVETLVIQKKGSPKKDDDKKGQKNSKDGKQS